MKATIKDVATLAGVSKSTVSQFLNGRFSYMSETTRKKIEEAIAELNYRPNQIAKSLKQKNTKIVALICATLHSRFSLNLIGSIEEFFQKEGYSVIIASSEDDSQKEKSLVESFLARQVDGILVFPTSQNKEYYQKLAEQRIPLVFLDRQLSGVDVPSVLLDNKLAGAMATQLLIDQGHAKIALFTFPVKDRITTRIERIEGYEETLVKNKLTRPDEFVVCCELEELADRLDQLFQYTPKPTALIMGNDMLLEESLFWSKREKKKIPDDFSLVGIDDVSFARLFDSEITTLAQPIEKIALKAASLLWEQIQGISQETTSDSYLYKPTLIQRSSVKKLN